MKLNRYNQKKKEKNNSNNNFSHTNQSFKRIKRIQLNNLTIIWNKLMNWIKGNKIKIIMMNNQFHQEVKGKNICKEKSQFKKYC